MFGMRAVMGAEAELEASAGSRVWYQTCGSGLCRNPPAIPTQNTVGLESRTSPASSKTICPSGFR